MPCSIPYIPERLHRNDRPTVNQFRVGERIYRRCKQEYKKNPFASVSLIDISVNRQGLNEILSVPEDVLYNIDLENGLGNIYKDYVVCEMEIIDLVDNSFYFKEYENTKTENGQPRIDKCSMRLIHKHLECNYSHCTFEIYFNDIEMVNKNVYDKYLNRCKALRNWCRNELVKMIIKEEISVIDDLNPLVS